MARLSTVGRKIPVPVGTIEVFPANAIPDGWILCNGSVLDAVTNPQYQRLYDIIGNTYGGTDNTDFLLPDCRGRFLRGADSGRGVDVGRTLGSLQSPQLGDHGHGAGSLSVDGIAPHSHPATLAAANAPHNHTVPNSGVANAPFAFNNSPSPSSSTNPLAAPTASPGNIHTHPISTPAVGVSGDHIHTLNGSVASTGSSEPAPAPSSFKEESRPRNVAMNLMIKV